MSQALDTPALVEKFWTVGRAPHDAAAKAFLARCEPGAVEVNGETYAYFTRGTGPTLLLVHGVHSNLGSMVPIAEELLQHGYRVALFDAPAHGEAVGRTTNPIAVCAVIRAVSDQLDELDAIVTHSLGGLWTLSAWDGEWRAKAFVSISSPSNLWFLVEKFAEFNNLDDDQVQELVRAIESDLGSDLWDRFSTRDRVKTLEIPGLILHGTSDELVPVEHASELHAGWRGSTMELVDGAGHFDIPGSPKVREMVPTYLEKVT